MRKIKELKKSEKLRAIRQIFTQFFVDLERCSISLMGNTLYVSGRLTKLDQTNVTVQELQELYRNLREYCIHLHTDLTNWDLNGWQIRKLNEELVMDHKKTSKQEEEEDEIMITLSKQDAAS